MKNPNLPVAVMLLFGISSVSAGTHYVDAGSTNPLPPYTTWDTAATNIQDAVASAMPNDEILVTNGVYAGNLAVTNPLTVASVNGSDFTIIVGDRSLLRRCAFLAPGASLSGFTLTNGGGPAPEGGGGVFCWGTNAFVTNCAIVGNYASPGFGGGAYGVRLYNCTLTQNTAQGGGGGAERCVLYNCILTRNVVLDNQVGAGGGAYESTLYNCILSSNESRYLGGGAYGCMLSNCSLIGNSAYASSGGAGVSTLYNCVITSNTVTAGQGGGVSGFQGGGVAGRTTLYNCVLSGNTAASGGGGASASTLYNCTLCGNSVTNTYGYAGGAWYATLYNCIIYSNTAPRLANYYAILNYCCTTPLPTNGVGNITNNPQFVDFANGNFRLQPNSPCINAGNNAYVTAITDLDGNPRISGSTVDIGTYEFQNPGSIISYAWLQQYGFPIDGSVDFTDPDGDGMNNWQEWICGTDPTDAGSVLKMLSPVPGTGGVAVPWLSVTNRSYFLQRATDLGVQPMFVTLATNIPGQFGTTTLVDTNLTGGDPFFYRVGTQR